MPLHSLKRCRLLVCSLLLLCGLNWPAHANIGEQGVATAIPYDIQQIFPSATRIGAPENKARVTPVFQLNELLGYVFESDDFTNIIGFSGQTVNLLIGIDPQGILVKLKVLNHHEPIFLHGLGERPMISFIKQFEGHSIKEHFIVDARDKRNQSVTHIDGVTKATVSALVINDTIIASALSVARTMLEGFAPLSSKSLKPNHYTEYNFKQLVETGYIKHWRLSLNDTLKQYPQLTDRLVEFENSQPLVDLYIAPLSIEMVGRNLLSQSEFNRLKENVGNDGNAFLVLDAGTYSFISEEFIAQTAPERFKIVQSGIPQDSRDIDFYSFLEPAFIAELPSHQRLMVLNIKGNSGFDLASEFEYHLNIDYNISFLTRNTLSLKMATTLPSDLFEVNEQASPKVVPLWQRIWHDRIWEIIVLLAYLILVLFVFSFPNFVAKRMVNNPADNQYLRSISLVFCLLFVGTYAQGQLSVVNIYTLLLSVTNGFDIYVFLLDPILFILWFFVFITVFIWGRGVFCGWLCPFGALQELVSRLASTFGIKQWKLDPALDARARVIKYVILIGLLLSAFYSLTLAERLAEVEPFKTAITMSFARYWPFAVYGIALLLLSLKIHKFYCRYVCPLGAGLALLGAFPLLKWITRRKECGSPCQLCKSKKCGINAIRPQGEINYRECVGCFDCVVTINDPSKCVIDKYAKKCRP